MFNVFQTRWLRVEMGLSNVFVSNVSNLGRSFSLSKIWQFEIKSLCISLSSSDLVKKEGIMFLCHQIIRTSDKLSDTIKDMQPLYSIIFPSGNPNQFTWAHFFTLIQQ